MKLATFDLSHPYIMLIKLNPVDPTEALLDEMCIQSEQIIKSLPAHKHVLVVDLTNGKYLPSELRVKQGNWMKKTEDLMNEKLEAIIMVNTSVMMNMVMKGIFLIKKPSLPTTFVKTIEEAFKLADEKLAVHI